MKSSTIYVIVGIVVIVIIILVYFLTKPKAAAATTVKPGTVNNNTPTGQATGLLGSLLGTSGISGLITSITGAAVAGQGANTNSFASVPAGCVDNGNGTYTDANGVIYDGYTGAIVG